MLNCWGLFAVQRGTTGLTYKQHLFTIEHPLTSHYISASQNNAWYNQSSPKILCGENKHH